MLKKNCDRFIWAPGATWLIVLGLCVASPTSDQSLAESIPIVQQDQPFQFSELDLKGRLFEAKITAEFPSDVAVSELLAEIGLDQANLVLSGHWIYGDPRSKAAMIAIFAVDGVWHCYLDKNRDRVFQPSELVLPIEGVPGHWQAELSAIQIEEDLIVNETLTYPVRIRFDAASNSAFIATGGTMNGQVLLDRQSVDARYEDRNANGQWFDADDRLFVDFNRDGQINPISERLPGQGMRTIAGQLYAVGGDPLGLTLSLTPVMERGEVIPRIKMLDDEAEIVSLKAALGSTTGIRIPIEKLNQPVSLPTGKWQVKEVLIKIKQNDEYFEFNFIQQGRKEGFEIGPDQLIDFDLLGELKLSAVTNVIDIGGSQRITIMPALLTESGCYLRAAHLGKHGPNIENRLISYTHFPVENIVRVGSSGFS